MEIHEDVVNDVGYDGRQQTHRRRSTVVTTVYGKGRGVDPWSGQKHRVTDRVQPRSLSGETDGRGCYRTSVYNVVDPSRDTPGSTDQDS